MSQFLREAQQFDTASKLFGKPELKTLADLAKLPVLRKDEFAKKQSGQPPFGLSLIHI